MGKPWAKLLRPDSLSGLQMVQLIRYGALFAMGIVLAKSNFSQESIGNFESLLFLTGAVSFFWVTGIIQSLLPLYNKSNSLGTGSDERRSPELFNAFLMLILFSIFAAGLVLLVGKWLSGFLNAELGQYLIYYVAAFVLFQSPSSLIEYIYLLKKKPRQMIRYGWLAFGFQFLSVSIAIVLELELKWVLLALVGSSLIRFIWLLVILRKYSEFKFSASFFKEHLFLGLPIVISVLLSGSAQYVDGLIITGYYDQAVFAVFRYGARELPLVALLAHALSSAMVPEIAQQGAVKGLKNLKNRSSELAAWLFPVTLALILSSHVLFLLLYEERFIESATIFNIYLLVISTRLLFPQTLLIAFKKTNFLMIASALELVMNIGLSLIFIQFMGIKGVAYATLVAYLFERIVLIVYVKLILGFPVSQYTNLRKHIIWTGVIVLAFIFTELYFGDVLNHLFL
ncbi:MAG: polysaccharide biosynthesis C-terminal domain-containing protein [Bacteroidales bacterium]|nr:polysaccharide biosynthesis C-terminal domain-containing protein [Bacteroidales bacterium]